MIVSIACAGRLEEMFNEDTIVSMRQFLDAKSIVKCWQKDQCRGAFV